MASKRIVVDPVTRIEGHLRIEVEIDSEQVVRNALCSGTMWRGLEVILQGRDPRDAWAFAQRICGVCTGVHALASVRAVEDALDIAIPQNANLVRNIMHLTLFAHDHLVHFYHLHALDWVDVLDAIRADPAATSALAQKISPWPKSSEGYFRNIQQRLTAIVHSGQLGPFRNGYWGHPAYRLPPEVNLLAVAHYLEALDFQREIVKIQAVFGGKNPHPNWLVGGVPISFNIDRAGALAAVNLERLSLVRSIAEQTRRFIEEVYWPDLLAIAAFYPEWARIGKGLAGSNMLSYGEFPRRAGDDSNESLRLPRGAFVQGKLDEIHPVDLRAAEEITEYVTHSWYRYPDEAVGRHPWEGITEWDFRLGAAAQQAEDGAILALDQAGKYSYIKAPRWRGYPMETGPLARLVIAYLAGHGAIRELIDDALKYLQLPFDALFSTLGRTLARGLEAVWAARELVSEIDRLIGELKRGILDTANIERWEPRSWPAQAKGVGFCEAPRGSLAHWIVIEEGRIVRYQAVVPTTWNASPRDAQGRMGPYEAALLGTPLAKAEEPLELLRTIHSFDPCLACATHILDAEGAELAVVTL